MFRCVIVHVHVCARARLCVECAPVYTAHMHVENVNAYVCACVWILPYNHVTS